MASEHGMIDYTRLRTKGSSEHETQTPCKPCSVNPDLRSSRLCAGRSSTYPLAASAGHGGHTRIFRTTVCYDRTGRSIANRYRTDNADACHTHCSPDQDTTLDSGACHAKRDAHADAHGCGQTLRSDDALARS